jgi:hypothetical protein
MNDINELVDLPDPAVNPLVHPLDLPKARRPYRTARLLRHRGHTRRRVLYALPGAVAVVASLGSRLRGAVRLRRPGVAGHRALGRGGHAGGRAAVGIGKLVTRP